MRRWALRVRALAVLCEQLCAVPGEQLGGERGRRRAAEELARSGERVCGRAVPEERSDRCRGLGQLAARLQPRLHASAHAGAEREREYGIPGQAHDPHGHVDGVYVLADREVSSMPHNVEHAAGGEQLTDRAPHPLEAPTAAVTAGGRHGHPEATHSRYEQEEHARREQHGVEVRGSSHAWQRHLALGRVERG